jgi:hypothetical protein
VGILISIFMGFMWMFVRLGILLIHLTVLMVRLSVPALVWMCKSAVAACIWAVKGTVLIYAGVVAMFITLLRATKKPSTSERQ